MTVAPGLSFPAFSAASISALPTLSFMLPAGLKYSSFAYISALKPLSPLYLFSFKSGVFPISSVMSSYTILYLQNTLNPELSVISNTAFLCIFKEKSYLFPVLFDRSQCFALYFGLFSSLSGLLRFICCIAAIAANAAADESNHAPRTSVG